MRMTVRVFALFAALLLLSATAAAQIAPRAIPDSDLFANAKRLKPGKPVVVSGMEMAAWEGNEPDPSCSNDNTHSVWFRVNLPLNGEITIYTYGTQLSHAGTNGYHPDIEERVTLSVYEGPTLDSLSELACAAPAGHPHETTTLRGIGLSAGFDVYIRASVDPGLTLLAPSQLRIQILPLFDDMLTNSSFYEGLNGWTVKGGSNDTAVDDEPGINNGLPAFKFTGNAGQNATLTQKRPLDGFNFGSSSVLEATVVYAHDLTDFDFRLIIKVAYLDGTKQKFTYQEARTFPDLNPSIGYIAWYPLQSGKIKSVKVSIPFAETAGTLVISDIYVGLRALAPARQ